VQQPARDLKSEKTWSSAAEAHFAKLPPEVLEIIAADASDTLDEAQSILCALARVQQVDDKVARTWASDPVRQTRMQKENPGIGPLAQLLRAFSPRQVPGVFPRLHQAREVLSGQARAQGYSQAQIDAWLASDSTLIQLIEQYLAEGYLLVNVPSDPRSYQDGLHEPGLRIPYMFGPRLTPELVRAAVSKHPDAIGILGPEYRSLDLYELVVARPDSATFSNFVVFEEVVEDPRHRAVLERLRLDGATAQATTSKRAVDWKSPAAARPSANAGGGERAQQRQRLLDEVPSGYRNFSSLSKTRKSLRHAAIQQLKHPSQEVDLWLAEEATTIELLSKVNSWTKQLAAFEWTESLACYCAAQLGSYDEIPEDLRSNPRVEAAMKAFADSSMRELTQYEDSDAGPRAGEGQSSS
jgi:hypothetical protein